MLAPSCCLLIFLGCLILTEWCMFFRAAAYTQIQKYSEALSDCLKSIEIDPNYVKAYSRLGLVYYAQGNYSDAIEKGFKRGLSELLSIPFKLCLMLLLPTYAAYCIASYVIMPSNVCLFIL